MAEHVSPHAEVRMPVETPSLFSQVIQEHLELKRKNSDLEGNMPISSYETEDPFENHPLFKTEEQARLEETMDGVEPEFAPEAESVLPWPGEDMTAENAASSTALATSTGATKDLLGSACAPQLPPLQPGCNPVAALEHRGDQLQVVDE